MKKRIISIAVIIALLACLAGCTSGQQEDTSGTGSSATVTSAADGSESTAGTDSGSTTGTGSPADGSESTTGTDSGVTATDIETVLTAYNDFLVDVYIEDHYDETFEEVRFNLCFINDDDIPELSVSAGYYHGSGADIYTYIGGEVVHVGCFGEWGSFGYVPRGGIIYSSYYGMGIDQLDVFTMHDDGSVEHTASFCEEELYDGDLWETVGTRYLVSDEETDYDTYEAARSACYPTDSDGQSLSRSIWYDDCASFSNTCYNRMDVLSYIYEKIAAGEAFTKYVTPEMEAMIGYWELTDADISDDTAGIYGIFYSDMVDSALTIYEDYYAEQLTSAYFADTGSALFLEDYYMPMEYLPMAVYDGIEHDEYCVMCETNSSDSSCYLVWYEEDGVETLEMIYFYNEEEYSDTVDGEDYYGISRSTLVAHYHRAVKEEPHGTKYFGLITSYPELTRNDATICYQLKEYLILTPDSDPALLAQYGLPADLDGYDFEIVDKGDEPMLVYASQFGSEMGDAFATTHYVLFDYETMRSVECDYEEFLYAVEGEDYANYGIFVYLYLEDGTDIANWIEEPYMS